jgi:hypothetical protein
LPGKPTDAGKTGGANVAPAWPNKDVPVMSARIAPEPVRSGFGAVADFRSRTALGYLGDPIDQHAQDNPAEPQQRQPAHPQLPPMPPPAPPPGAAFAVALITGQLPPKPTSERELQMRLGSAELPAQGSLALHDRLV